MAHTPCLAKWLREWMVVEKIQKTPCDEHDRPFEDMKIIKAVVVKLILLDALVRRLFKLFLWLVSLLLLTKHGRKRAFLSLAV